MIENGNRGKPEFTGFTQEGLVDLKQFEGVLEKKHWDLPDNEFVEWVNGSVWSKAKTIRVAVFEVGKTGSFKGQLMTRDLGKAGIPQEDAEGIELSDGEPYVVSVIVDTCPKSDKKGFLRLKVNRVFGREDCLRLVANKFTGSDEGNRLSQLIFLQGRRDKNAISRTRSQKPILPSKMIRNIPGDCEQWVGQIVAREDKFDIFYPYMRVEEWERHLVWLADGARLKVRREAIRGIDRDFLSDITIESVEDFQNNFVSLPEVEQAKLARLWNILRE